MVLVMAARMEMNNSPIMSLRLVLLTFQCLFSPVVSDGAQNPQFTPIQCNNTFICAVSQPLSFLYSVLSVTTCATECYFKQYQSASCVGFNYRATNYSCDFFTGDPLFFGEQHGCQYYQNTRHTKWNCTTLPGLQMGTLVASWVETFPVAATALLNGKLFVTGEGDARVSVYDTTLFQLLRTITFPGLGTVLYGIATSAINNLLYISDYSNACVHVVDLSVTSNLSVVTWNLPSPSYPLSLTSTGNVLVAISYKSINWIIEYTPAGSVVRQVNTSVMLARQVIEVNNDVWAFVSKSPATVCTVGLMNSTVIKCSGSWNGSEVIQLNTPIGLAMDSHGYFIVVDYGNNRIIVVDPSLTNARQLQFPTLQLPRTISLDQSRGRLYVGEASVQRRVMVFDGLW